ncbi:aldo/keto reductase [Nocardiopsis xinjiangensis]|uniref:aldo/keto reductase n=1 Tax=Nocardiopsis xinjiangensis TaxID=124285 RepID=UPI00034CE52D|nr:aldo/keto reductase [Nocardiopsis xinjiangensis]
MMTIASDASLNNGLRMPQMGLGVWQVPQSTVADTVATALEAGYRSIDTASSYGNEAGVGEGLRRSGVDREDVFLASKLANPDQGYDSALRAFDATLERMRLDHLDLYLLHWPLPHRDLYVSSWRALERLYADGRVRAIGVCNFQLPHLERVLDEGGIVPMVNQIELHPLLVQNELRDFHSRHNIATEAWSPLGHGNLLEEPTVTGIAGELDRTPAQVLLRWQIQLGNVTVPKSVTPERIRANFDVFDFELSTEDMQALSALDQHRRFGPDPDEFDGD